VTAVLAGGGPADRVWLDKGRLPFCRLLGQVTIHGCSQRMFAFGLLSTFGRFVTSVQVMELTALPREPSELRKKPYP
jgi:hypothetical protein